VYLDPTDERVLAFFVNLLSIYNKFFWSDNAESHFVASDAYNRYANVVVYNERFPDSSC